MKTTALRTAAAFVLVLLSQTPLLAFPVGPQTEYAGGFSITPHYAYTHREVKVVNRGLRGSYERNLFDVQIGYAFEFFGRREVFISLGNADINAELDNVRYNGSNTFEWGVGLRDTLWHNDRFWLTTQSTYIFCNNIDMETNGRPNGQAKLSEIQSSLTLHTRVGNVLPYASVIYNNSYLELSALGGEKTDDVSHIAGAVGFDLAWTDHSMLNLEAQFGDQKCLSVGWVYRFDGDSFR